MLSEEKIVKLCRDASYGDYPWQLLLQNLTSWLGGDKAMLMHSSNIVGYNHSIAHQHDPDTQKLYNQHYYKLDPRSAKSLTFKAGEVSTGQQIAPNDSYQKTAYYNDVTIAGDVKDSVHGVISDDIELGRRAISIQRGFSSDYFDKPELKKLKFILPHLDRALRDSLRLTRILAIDKSPKSLIYGLIDPAFRLHFFDSNDQLLFAGMIVDRAKQQLRIENKTLERVLPDIIRSAAKGRSRSIQLAHAHLNLSKPPSALGWMGLDEIALFTISERSKVVDTKLFSDAFNLTPREAEILDLLLILGNRQRICERLSLSPETLRWHVKNILSKTGYGKSSDLVNAASHNDLSNCS